MKKTYKNLTKIVLIMMIIFLFCGFDTKEKVPIFSVKKEEKVLSITFDMNWGEDYTSDILKVLDKHEIKATFFVMGKWAIYPKENMEVLKNIYLKGHEIGNHSYLHPMFSKISKDRMEKEINDTNKVIKEIIGEDIRLFRFPSGDFNSLGVEVVENMGMYPIQWNVDSIDWKNIGEDYEFKRVKDNIKPGSIILYHNTGRHTAKNLDKLLIYLKSEGYSIKTTGEMIFRENYIIDNNGLQISKWKTWN